MLWHPSPFPSRPPRAFLFGPWDDSGTFLPMTLAECFDRLKKKDEKALVLFVTAGDPTLEDLPEILDALQEGGADVIEIGVPFSDPIADGPVIQASSHRALQRGVTPDAVLKALAKCNLCVPVVLMGYYNTVLAMGADAFANSARDAGVTGMIVCDLVPEEAADWKPVANDAGIDTVFLAAPTSTDERIAEIAAVSTGFVYAVSRTGVTGMGPQDSATNYLVTRLRVKTTLPVMIGFGISSPETVRDACRQADGAIIGSWLVDWLDKNWQDGKGRQALVNEVKALKDATRP